MEQEVVKEDEGCGRERDSLNCFALAAMTIITKVTIVGVLTMNQAPALIIYILVSKTAIHPHHLGAYCK